MAKRDIIGELLRLGYLKRHRSDIVQAKKLLIRSQRDLKTARVVIEVDAEASYMFAYLAISRASRALLLVKGYRPSVDGQERTVVEAMGALGGRKFGDMVLKFDRMRRKRIQVTYDPDLPMSKSQASEAVKTAEAFHHLMRPFIKETHGQLRLPL